MNTPHPIPLIQLDLFGNGEPLPPPERVPCPTCHGCGTVSPAEALGYAPGRVSAAHPETSQKAARRVSNRVRFGTQRHRCMDALADGALTAAEVADRIGLSRNQTATRLGELREAGFVAYLVMNGARVTRPTGPNDEGLLHRLTTAGREALEDIK